MPDTITMSTPAAGSEASHPSRRVGDYGLLENSKLEDVDRLANATMAKMTLGLSPVSLAMTWFDWAVHLASSPGKQFELAEKAVRKTTRYNEHAVKSLFGEADEPCIEPLVQDRRFRDETWNILPYHLMSQAFLLYQQWWHNATTGVRGVSKRHEQATEFFSRQLLDTVAPSNNPYLNPEIIRATFQEGGENLKRGARNWIDDMGRKARNEPPAGAEQFKVGENLAITPGKVVYRNHLMELIQYEPRTTAVHREPVLMQSAWMMKYYIMDLSRRNSLVKYLVDRGHTVFMISWRNPGSEDRDLGMEDYRRMGTMAAIDAISEIVPDEKIHGVGYCLGGILLTIAAAAMARDGDDRLKSITLFTTLTDFTDVGEMGIFMDTSQVAFMEDMMWEQGYLDPQMAHGSFQLLKSRDLIWSKMIREYWLGERDKMFDLMAWNSDGTRMPYRQHSELLRRLYRDNALFQGSRLVAIIDFFSAGNGYLLFDLAVVANDWCSRPDGGLDEQRLRPLLQGYQSQRTVSAEEKRLWNDFLRIAAARFWISRLLARLEPRAEHRPGALTEPRDPTVYRNILVQRIHSPKQWDSGSR